MMFKSELLVGIICFALADVLNACTKEMVEKGLEECQKAVKETYDENTMKFITQPKVSSCCLTHLTNDCVMHAFEEADCDPDKNEITKEIGESLDVLSNKAQETIEQFSKLMCGDTTDSSCAHLAEDFIEAKKEITEINGVGATGPSTLLSFLLLAMVSVRYW